MITSSFIITLKKALSESCWPWVLSALQQDPLIWRSLETEFGMRAVQALAERASAYSPAALALLALSAEGQLEELRATPLAPASDELRQRAAQAVKAELLPNALFSAGPAGQTQSEIRDEYPAHLARAGLLAIHARERRWSSGSWENAFAGLVNDLPTILACLWGMLGDPNELLHMLVESGKEFGRQSGVRLGLHAFLCQPLPFDGQVEGLKTLLEELPAQKRPDFLVTLSSQRPELARELFGQVTITSGTSAQAGAHPLLHLGQLVKEADSMSVTGRPGQEVSILQEAQLVTARWQGGLSARLALALQAQGNEPAALSAWEQAVQLDPETPGHLAGLALALMNAGRSVDAANCLEAHPLIASDPSVRYASARLALQNGDVETARQAAAQAVQGLQAASLTRPDRYITLLASLLDELQMPAEAAAVLQAELSIRPNQPDLLNLLSRSRRLTGELAAAVAAAHLAVGLAPDRLDLRRQLASCIETLGDWPAAYEERSRIVERCEMDGTQPEGDDLLSLAYTALHSEHPDSAATAGRKALDLNPEDALAAALLGEAILALGDTPAALAQLKQATQLGPHQPVTWLALARAQAAAGHNDPAQAAAALVTLQAATRAAPDAPEIYLALGETYLARNAPTQALSALRRAVELAETTPPHRHAFTSCPPGTIAMRLGQTLNLLGHTAEALQYLARAHQEAPADPRVAYAYAQLLIHAGDPAQAIAPLEVILSSPSNDAAPVLDYARCVLVVPASSRQPARLERALSTLQAVLAREPGQLEARGLLAETLAAAGRWSQALDAYRQAIDSGLLRLPGWNSRLSLGLGRSALASGQVETAIAALQEASQADPHDSAIQRTLCEAYTTASLPKDAFQAARAALRLAPDDVDTLVWFARQALEMQALPGGVNLQTQPEAIAALDRAIQLAPARTDLIIQMGQIQFKTGDHAGARRTFNRLIAPEAQAATAVQPIEELHEAAQSLLHLGDPSGAAACLERALQNNRRYSDWDAVQKVHQSPGLIELLSDLASARYLSGKLPATLEAIEQAIGLSPEDPALFTDKADLFLELDACQPEAGHLSAALSCLEMALRLDPQNPALKLRQSLALRAAGDLPSAAQAIDSTLHLIEHRHSQTEKDAITRWSARALAAEIALARLDAVHARDLLSGSDSNNNSGAAPDQIEYRCLRAELALESGNVARAAEDLGPVLDQSSNQPRLLAIQSRLVGRRGDQEVAFQFLRDASQALLDEEAALKIELSATKDAAFASTRFDGNKGKAIYRGAGLIAARYHLLHGRLAFADASADLYQWEAALQALQLAAAAAPREPVIQVKIARLLALRAEAQQLCAALDVVRHAPGERALSEESRRAFETAIETAHKLLADGSQELTPPASLARWEARGRAAFEPGVQSARELAAYANNPDDVAARIACLRAAGELPATGNAARAFPQHPGVLIQLALALETEKPRQALAAAHIAAEAVLHGERLATTEAGAQGESRRDDTPLIQALLARLIYKNGNRAGDDSAALQAIQAALLLWPDEPRWHSLAARIHLGRGGIAGNQAVEPASAPDISAAIAHLEQAIKLEPKNASHLSYIGQIYLEEGSLPQAITVLEQACRLAPDDPQPWLALATACRAAGDMDQAAVRAERAIALDPDNLEPILLRGEIALQANNPRGAQSRAQAALKLAPDHPGALLLMARSLNALDRPAEALEIIDQALPKAADTLPFELERARLLLRTEGQETALQALQVLAARSPDESSVLALLAETLAEAGQREGAIYTAQRALQAGHHAPAGQAFIEHAGLHSLLGRLMRQAGQLDQAIHHLSEAIRLAPGLAEPYLELGHTHQERRQYAQALSAYEKATAAAPYDARAFYFAGQAYKESKDYPAAEKMLRRAASLAPNDVSIHRLLAAVVALNLVHNRREPQREEQSYSRTGQ